MKRSWLSVMVLGSCMALPVLGNAQEAQQVPMAKLCMSCHEPQQGVMMGFLEQISLKTKMIQMNFLSHKEVVKFTDDTKIKNVNSFADIRNYTGKGFTVNFREKDGENIATEIIRFDILSAVADEEKLTPEQFLSLYKEGKAKIYDVRPPMKYQAAHIPGAGMIPAPAFDKFAGKLPEDKNTPIVFYGVGGCLSPTSSMKAKALGYTDVKIYTGGYPDWVKNNHGVTEAVWLKSALAKDIPHVLIDLRGKQEVAAGHIKGAINIEPANLEARKGDFPADKKAPIILYGTGSADAADHIHSWGYKKVQVLATDFEQWKTAGNPVEQGETKNEIAYVAKPLPGTIAIADFEAMVKNPPANVIFIDVRNANEYAEGSIKDSLNIPADMVDKRLADIPEGKEIVLYCNTGVLAEIAHTALVKKGRTSRYLAGRVSFEDGEMEVEAL